MFAYQAARNQSQLSLSSEDDEPQSPTSETHGEMGETNDDEDFESSVEDSQPSPDMPALLGDDPFSNKDSQRLFNSIGMPSGS